MRQSRFRLSGENTTDLIFPLCLAVITKFLAEGLDAEQVTRQREFDTDHDGIGL